MLGKEEITIRFHKAKREIAGSRHAVPFGKRLAELGELGGHSSDYYGTYNPAFPLRALCLDAPNRVLITNDFCIRAPTCTDLDAVQVAERLFELGYNALVMGAWDANSRVLDQPADVLSWVKKLKDQGVEIIVKVDWVGSGSVCPLNNIYREKFQNGLHETLSRLPKGVSVLFSSKCEQKEFYQDPAGADATTFELLLSEMRLVEEVLDRNQSLYFHIPPAPFLRASFWTKDIHRLCDDAGLRTSLAVAYPENQPFWTSLRGLSECGSTPIISIVDSGNVHRGQGLWPVAANNALSKLLPFSHKHPLGGIIGNSPGLPRKGSFLEASLLCWSFALWTKRTDSHLLETWGNAYYPELASRYFLKFVSLAEEIVSGLGDLPNVPFTMALKEGIQGRIKELEGMAKSLKSSLSDAVPFFLRDMRRILENQEGIKSSFTPGLGSLDGIAEGIWWSKDGTQLSLPNRGVPGSPLERWVKKNALLEAHDLS